jgi:uncharacterized protein YkwD
MLRYVRFVPVCLALGGCASSGGIPAPATGFASSEPAKLTSAPAQTAREEGGSGLGSVWSNFSSAFSSGAQPVSQKLAQSTSGTGLDQDEALRLINGYRAAKGLSPVSIDPQATQAAEVLARDMAAHDRMSHSGPGGQDVGKRLLAAGYNFSVASENVGVGQTTIEETIDGWKASAGNRRNMLLASATHIGIAYESRPDSRHKTFWVLVVAAP